MAIEANKEYVVNIGGSSTYTPSLSDKTFDDISCSVRMVEGSKNVTINPTSIAFDNSYNQIKLSDLVGNYIQFQIYNGEILVSGAYNNGDDFIDPTTAEITFNSAIDLGEYESWFMASMVSDDPKPLSDKLITLDNLAVFKEEEDALLAEKMANPMTTQGDLVVGGANGAPTRLPKGTEGQVLTAGANGPEWTTPSGGGGTQFYHHKVICDDDNDYLYVLSTSNAAITSISGLTNYNAILIGFGEGDGSFMSTNVFVAFDSNTYDYKLYYNNGASNVDITGRFGTIVRDDISAI